MLNVTKKKRPLATKKAVTKKIGTTVKRRSMTTATAAALAAAAVKPPAPPAPVELAIPVKPYGSPEPRAFFDQHLKNKRVLVLGANGQYLTSWGSTSTVDPKKEVVLTSCGFHRREGDIGSFNVAGSGWAEGYQIVLDLHTARFVVLGDAASDPFHEMRLSFRQTKYHDYVGTDPEFFFVNAKGELVPSFEVLPKRKGKEVTPFWDGYQGEFGTRATTCLNEQVNELAHQFSKLERYTHKHRLSLSTRSTFDIPMERLANDEEEFVAFGCTPSLSVYGETFPPADPRTVPFRSAGGHMHFSFDNGRQERVPDVIRALDKVLSVMNVAMFRRWEDPRRRIMYGRAGEYRETKYGFEYRTPSNAWLITPLFMNFQFEVARRIIGDVLLNNGKAIAQWQSSEEEYRACINNNDVDLALTILERNRLIFDALLGSLPGITSQADVDGIRRRVIEGFDTMLTNPDKWDPRWWNGAFSTGLARLSFGGVDRMSRNNQPFIDTNIR